ncbi:SUF system Fe-S cluster assembly regulator [Lichenicoccus sp.]|uniref:SUF system Fe-S cluster assembly regulator n=1 Tax=Lichenicoccus sp. TaxID=2781899 RepID=UPI003D0F70A9
MLRLSKLTDYAVVVMVHLESCGGVTTSPSLALETGIPEPTVAKVLKALSGAGLVVSQRGPRGGYRLASDLAQVPVARVIAAIDGPISLTACVDGAVGGCEAQGLCPVRGRWDAVNAAIRTALTHITLADMRPQPRPAAFVPDPRPTARVASEVAE